MAVPNDVLVNYYQLDFQKRTKMMRRLGWSWGEKREEEEKEEGEEDEEGEKRRRKRRGRRRGSPITTSAKLPVL